MKAVAPTKTIRPPPRKIARLQVRPHALLLVIDARGRCYVHRPCRGHRYERDPPLRTGQLTPHLRRSNVSSVSTAVTQRNPIVGPSTAAPRASRAKVSWKGARSASASLIHLRRWPTTRATPA